MDQMSSFASATSPGAEPSVPRGVDPLWIRTPRNRLARRFILWRTLNTFFWAIGVIGALVLPYVLFDSIRTWLEPIIWIMSAIFVVNLLFMPTYRYLVHRWETSDRTVYTLSGWITREWRIIPVSRIQSIDTVQGPLQQLLSLATIKVSTASGQGGITIEGLDAEVARKAVRDLNEITQDTPGDAT